MVRWLSRTFAFALVLLAVGIGLVAVSGHGGNRTGGSELVWRIGGVMVYASAAAFLAAVLLGIGLALWQSLVLLRRAIWR